MDALLKNLQLLGLLLVLAACSANPSSSRPAPVDTQEESMDPIREGTYSTPNCFLNKIASQGVGSNVYTRTTMSFNAQGIGRNEYALYLDSACNNVAQVGSANIEISYVKTLGEILILKMLQYDPNDGSEETQTFWLSGVISGDDYYLDLDYTRGISGPYQSEPNAADVANFATNPKTLGVLLQAE